MKELEHKPYGANPEGYTGVKRSLLLAGGGMRVAYQAGVILALIESGMTFSHVDGTSGGSINMSMLFSGLSPQSICDRWRTLKVQDFVSLMPLKKYLDASGLLAMADADGIVQGVFPHLGIDVEKIKAAIAIQGTYNIGNFSLKTNEVFPHQAIDLDLLVAGISIPILMPPVTRGEYFYTDPLWIKNTNLIEAVHQGAEEIWVIWCIGNTKEYNSGLFKQFIQMMEITANSALFAECDRINEINKLILQGHSIYGQTKPIKLHLIKPTYPLPLDPDLYFGNIDAATLIDLGYADAYQYLQTMQPQGLPFTNEITQMKENQLGITFRETMAGSFSLENTDPRAGETQGKAEKTHLAMHATVNIRDLERFISDPNHLGSITGHIDFSLFGENIPAKTGVFNLFSPTDQPELKLMIYELAFSHKGQDYYLAGKKEVRDDPGFDLWSDTTTLYCQLHQGTDKSGTVVGAGVLSLNVAELAKLVSTMRVTNAESLPEKTKALFDFGKFFLGELWDSYGPKL
ncbi:putative esterase of the alpha-beta hydrolase superfamily [Xenococcus sp. PCC 7305]|uniref:patatin-like phospholipase family protein n=1 Tax=Xenococcus sp. PCC 7305 TaxID=102125 RepID=UPI0002ABFBB5|nr:patatin-like phospholipase family protein [Xenococcus sp. PCC 7305]ELS02362.1 putative esterase of the alpha-beta hydrolase superfamily [Xenococcus sp. PCC 7305]